MSFYAVKIGRIPGIYKSWNECKNQIDKFSGATFKKFSNEREANKFVCSGNLSISSSSSQSNILTSVLYSDGGHNKKTGNEAWGSVVNSNKKDLLETYQNLFSDMESKIVDLPVGKRRIIISKFNDVKSQQNNGAELIALVVSLRIALSSNDVKTIKCDSSLLTEYWSKYLKKESRDKMDVKKAGFIDELIIRRKKFEENGGVIEKISGDDNFADIGFHK